jgi:glycolate dehydrogenase FAD-binding subunit
MSSVRAAISSGLAGIVGPGNVEADTVQLSAFRIGASVPKAIVRPGSNQETAEIVRLAAAEKLALVPVGARTKLGMNIPVHQYDLALDMTRLDRVVAYDPDDLTLSVEPGISLETLSCVLAENRQFLPLAVPFLKRATVAGTIASGVDSPLRQFYGTARDYLLGLEFVTGEGQIVKSGGRVVKNVSGYDLHKLMIGSLGSLGVITKVNFRTFPVPQSTRVFVAFLDSADRAVEMRQRVAQSPLRPLTMEILSPHAAELLTGAAAAQVEPGQMRADAFANGRWVFAASYTGTETVLARYERELRQLAGPADSSQLSEDAAAVALRRMREFIPIALESSPATVVVKMSVLPARMGGLLHEAESIAARSDLRCAAVARGVGVAYVALLPAARDEQSRATVVRALHEFFKSCESRAGNFSVPWCPTEWHASLPEQRARSTESDLMRKLKHVFDPAGVFAPDPPASGR